MHIQDDKVIQCVLQFSVLVSVLRNFNDLTAMHPTVTPKLLVMSSHL